MSSFADQLKAEIARIARKQMRAELQALKKANSAYRSDIAALKRRVAQLESGLAKAARQSPTQRGRAESADTDAGSEQKRRFRVGGFAALRKKLGVSAADMGKLLGVSAQSVYHWETGKTRPRASQLQAIAQVRSLGKREVARRLAA